MNECHPAGYFGLYPNTLPLDVQSTVDALERNDLAHHRSIGNYRAAAQRHWQEACDDRCETRTEFIDQTLTRLREEFQYQMNEIALREQWIG